MELNTYVPTLSHVFRGMKPQKGQHLDKRSVYEAITRFCDPTLMAASYAMALPALGRPQPSGYQMTRMVADASTIFFAEAVSLFYGVVVRVEDANLVKALLRTKMDAVVGDIRMPYPIMEIWFPPGIYFENGMEVNAALVIDANQFSIDKEVEKQSGIKKHDIDSHGRPLADYWVISRVLTAGHTDYDTCIHRFCKNDLLFASDTECYLPDNEKSYIVQMAQLVMGLMLYIQCYENRSDVCVKQNDPPRFKGMPGHMAHIAKKRASYVIRDMLGLGKDYERSERESGDNHASPRPHWRTWTLRSLRHERFKRNADGSIRVILVKPFMVGVKDENDETRGERKISAQSQQDQENVPV